MPRFLRIQAVEAGLLASRLTEVFARRAQRVLFLRAASGLELQTVATAIDTAQGAKVARLALMPGR